RCPRARRGPVRPRASPPNAPALRRTPRVRSPRLRRWSCQGAKHGPPLQTSTTLPVGFRNSDFCVRALGWLRGQPCASPLPLTAEGGSCAHSGSLGERRGGTLSIGGAGLPLSHTTSAEPSKG